MLRDLCTCVANLLLSCGMQVEQPFKIMPLWQLCHLAQINVEEALSTPDLPLRLNRKSEATTGTWDQSGNPFG